MLGYQDKPDQLDLAFLPGQVDGFAQPTPPNVIDQQRHSPIAGKRQLVKMPRLVEMPNLLPMLLRPSHDRNYAAMGLYWPFAVKYSRPSLPRDLAAIVDSMSESRVVQHGPKPVAPTRNPRDRQWHLAARVLSGSFTCTAAIPTLFPPHGIGCSKLYACHTSYLDSLRNELAGTKPSCGYLGSPSVASSSSVLSPRLTVILTTSAGRNLRSTWS